ncbi:MAG: transporter [Bacteroidota bacterium]|nr:transporter [Bacteroidota bacterium]
MYRIILFVILIIQFQNNLFSQQLPSIQTDRPDQTETPFTVPANHFQLEAGFVYEKDKEIITTSIPTTLFKFGVSDNFELRLILDITEEKKQGGSTEPGLNPVEIGIKINIAKEDGIIPTASLIGHLAIPEFLSDQNQIIYFAPNFRFCMQNTLSDKFTLVYNLGAEWDGLSAEPAFIYTVTTAVSVSEKLGGYVELYGFAPQKNKADHRFDMGITYLIKKNFQLDVSGGTAISDNAPDYFFGFGLSVRLPN